MTDYTGRHIAGFAEGFGLNIDHINSVFDILSKNAGVLKESIEIKLVDSGDIPGCGFTANLTDSIDIDDILNALRSTNHFNSVSGFQVDPDQLALQGLKLAPEQLVVSPEQFTLTA